jgi:hypothetical protein
VKLLRARAEPGAAHLAQECLQPRRIGLLVGHLRLEMEASRALGGQCAALRRERRVQHGDLGDVLGGGHGDRLPEPNAWATETL